MKGIKIGLVAAVIISAAFSMGVGSADSKRCDQGDAKYGGGGIYVANHGDPAGRQGWAAVCSDGSGVPIGGQVEAGGDLANGESGWVHVDGDEGNGDYHKCADGFARMEADSSGKNDWYSGPDGDWKDTNGSASGAPKAPKKSADEVVTDTIADCQ